MDPYLTQHEREIDQTLKDIQKQAMAMGMDYIKRAINLMQNLAWDLYKKVSYNASETVHSTVHSGVPDTTPNLFHPSPKIKQAPRPSARTRILSSNRLLNRQLIPPSSPHLRLTLSKRQHQPPRAIYHGCRPNLQP